MFPFTRDKKQLHPSTAINNYSKDINSISDEGMTLNLSQGKQYKALKIVKNLIKSQNLDADRKKKLKMTLRLIHHPDQGGSNEYYLAIEEAFEKLNY